MSQRDSVTIMLVPVPVCDNGWRRAQPHKPRPQQPAKSRYVPFRPERDLARFDPSRLRREVAEYLRDGRRAHELLRADGAAMLAA
jgi:hypothetical protein